MEPQTVDTDVQTGVLSRLIGVFVSPGATFSSLNVRVGWKDWLIPLILVVLVIGAAGYFTAPLTQEFRMEMTRARFEKNPNMTDEQKEQALQKVEKMQQSGIVTTVAAPVATTVFLFITSAIFLALVNFVLGGEATYKKTLVVVSLSSLVNIPATIVTVPLALSQGTPFVHLGLGAFLPDSMSQSFLSGALMYLNVFKIWEYALLSIGMAAIAGISAKKAAWGMFILLVLFALASGGMMRLSGMG